MLCPVVGIQFEGLVEIFDSVIEILARRTDVERRTLGDVVLALTEDVYVNVEAEFILVNLYGVFLHLCCLLFLSIFSPAARNP